MQAARLHHRADHLCAAGGEGSRPADEEDRQRVPVRAADRADLRLPADDRRISRSLRRLGSAGRRAARRDRQTHPRRPEGARGREEEVMRVLARVAAEYWPEVVAHLWSSTIFLALVLLALLLLRSRLTASARFALVFVG